MSDAAGHLASHMAVHILAMNIFAPGLAYAWWRVRRGASGGVPGLAFATVLQLGTLWAWHIPAALAFAANVPAGAALMHASLFAAALLFWLAIFDQAAAEPWRSIAALLVTGKLFCLLGVLFVFAPRPLFAHAAGTMMTAQAALDDQQLAGLFMLIACPLTYVVAGIVIVRAWFDSSERAPGWTFDRAGP